MALMLYMKNGRFSQNMKRGSKVRNCESKGFPNNWLGKLIEWHIHHDLAWHMELMLDKFGIAFRLGHSCHFHTQALLPRSCCDLLSQSSSSEHKLHSYELLDFPNNLRGSSLEQHKRHGLERNMVEKLGKFRKDFQ